MNIKLSLFAVFSFFAIIGCKTPKDLSSNISAKQTNNVEIGESGVKTNQANISKRDSIAENIDERIVIMKYDTDKKPDSSGKYPLKSETIIERTKQKITISDAKEEKKDSTGYQFSYADKSKNKTDIKVKETVKKGNFAYLYYSLLVILILALMALVIWKRKPISRLFRRLLNVF